MAVFIHSSPGLIRTVVCLAVALVANRAGLAWGGERPMVERIEPLAVRVGELREITLHGHNLQEVTGLHISEHLPRIAKVCDKLAIVRSLHHRMRDHNAATFETLCGHTPAFWFLSGYGRRQRALIESVSGSFQAGVSSLRHSDRTR